MIASFGKTIPKPLYFYHFEHTAYHEIPRNKIIFWHFFEKLLRLNNLPWLGVQFKQCSAHIKIPIIKSFQSTSMNTFSNPKHFSHSKPATTTLKPINDKSQSVFAFFIFYLLQFQEPQKPRSNAATTVLRFSMVKNLQFCFYSHWFRLQFLGFIMFT